MPAMIGRGQRRRGVSHERRHRPVHGKEWTEGAALLGERPREGHLDQGQIEGD